MLGERLGDGIGVVVVDDCKINFISNPSSGMKDRGTGSHTGSEAYHFHVFLHIITYL